MLGHRPGLDGLRGLAVVAVVAYHLALPGASGGFLGVTLFFTLSGYLITGLVLAEVDRSGRVDWARFTRARAGRLVPGLVGCVLLVVVLGVLGSGVGGGDGAALRLDALTSLLGLHNWQLVLAHVPYGAGFGAPSPLLHLWSVAVEAQLYLLWPPLLAALLARHRGRPTHPGWVALVAVDLAALSTLATALLVDLDHTGRVYYGTDTRAAEFLVGAALALALPATRGAARWTRELDLAGIAALTVLALVVTGVDEFSEPLYRGGFTVVALLAAVVVAAAAQPGSATGRVLGGRLLRGLGQRSYGLYLYHWPILVLTGGGRGIPFGAVGTVARVGALLAVAALSHRFLEQPLRRRWTRSGDAGRAPARSALPQPLAPSALPAPPVGVRAPRRGSWPPGSWSPVSWSPVSRRLARSAVPALLVGGLVAVVLAAPLLVPDHDTAPVAAVRDGASASTSTSSGVGASAPAAAERAPGPAGAGTARRPPALVVGDSLADTSAAELRDALGPATTIDAVIGRQFSAAPARVASWTATHPGPVVLVLGTNGVIRDEDVDAVLGATGPRRVVLVTVATAEPWRERDNAALHRAADLHPDTVRIADWAGLVARTPGLLDLDDVHPVPRGAVALAEVVRTALDAAPSRRG